ncbi:hypothetical protein CK203_090510 [Vitis vinifera]|uniref:Retroviral polymerase SH3-like domain-containing protein n=1 Tax=Vitis vinifera TaxID=29760 RepID=A0A438BTR5_VITVI|nr:hypothetical protein CK203_090510 [Vitis vinifera]
MENGQAQAASSELGSFSSNDEIMSWHFRSQLEPCVIKCVFLGYSSNKRGYKCFDPISGGKRSVASKWVFTVKYNPDRKFSGQPYRHQKTLTIVRKPSPLATFPAKSFSDTDHTIRCARRRSSSFVKAPEGESQSRTGHAHFFSSGLNLTHRLVRARRALSGNALPLPASPDAV